MSEVTGFTWLDHFVNLGCFRRLQSRYSWGECSPLLGYRGRIPGWFDSSLAYNLAKRSEFIVEGDKQYPPKAYNTPVFTHARTGLLCCGHYRYTYSVLKSDSLMLVLCSKCQVRSEPAGCNLSMDRWSTFFVYPCPYPDNTRLSDVNKLLAIALSLPQPRYKDHISPKWHRDHLFSKRAANPLCFLVSKSIPGSLPFQAHLL